MAFINPSEASQIQSTYGQSAEHIAKLLEYLLTRLAQIQSSPKAQPLTPEEEQLAHVGCAHAAMEAVKQYGKVYPQESGNEASCYCADGYTVSTDFHDPCAMPIYTVAATGKGNVLSFQQHPKTGELVFFETESTLDNEQLAEMMKAFQSAQQEKESSLTGVPAVQERLLQMGDMAPYGSKALLVADALLQQAEKSGQSKVTGNIYTFDRASDGGISINYKDFPLSEPLFQMSAAGTVSHSGAAWMQNHKDNFAQMYDKLFQAQPQLAMATTSPHKGQKTEIGGR